MSGTHYPITGDFSSMTYMLDMASRPRIEFVEDWHAAAIDAAVWTATNPATGAAWTPQALSQLDGYLRGNAVAPNANETARLISVRQWEVQPWTWSHHFILGRTILEFEAKVFSGLANLDNTNTLLGALTELAIDTRASVVSNMVGWALSGDVLEAFSCNLPGGGTKTTAVSGTLTTWNKFRIDVQLDHIYYYFNEALVANHTTYLGHVPSFLNFYLDTEAGGAAVYHLGHVRIWHEDMRSRVNR